MAKPCLHSVRWTLLLSWCLTVMTGWATADLGYTTRAWQRDEGLLQLTVRALAQTPDGYLWVGTKQGILRFDGMKFAPLAPTGRPELDTAQVNSLLVTKDGTLWIGTERAGLYQCRDGTFSRLTLPSKNAMQTVLNLYEDTVGTVWISGKTGLYFWKGGEVERFSADETLAQTTTRAVCQDPSGRYWFGTSIGLFSWENGVMTNYAVINGMRNDFVRGLHWDRRGALWMCSNRGVTCLTNGDPAQAFQYTNSNPTYASVRADRHGTVWIGSFGGLFHMQDGKPEPQLTATGFPYDVINCFFEDAEGDLWVGAKDGLFRLDTKRFGWITTKEGLNNNNVMSVFEDSRQQTWVGTWGGGLHRLNAEGMRTFITKQPHYGPDLVLGVSEDSAGTIWAGADFRRGLYRLEEDRFVPQAGGTNFTPEAIRVIHPDHAGGLWVGMANGLARWRGEQTETFTIREGLPSNLVRVIQEDDMHNLWIGTDAGLVRWVEDGPNHFARAQPPVASRVASLYAETGTLWIGTVGGGLLRLRDGKITAYTMARGLADNDIFEILDDGQGHLWMSSLHGIFYVRKADFDALDKGEISSLGAVSFVNGDDQINIQCNGVAKPAAWKRQDGSLLFATTKGVIVVNLESVFERNEKPPLVAIEKVVSDNVDLSVRASSLSKKSGPVLSIPPGRGELEFNYTALSLREPEKNRFQYRLAGLSTNWVEAGLRRTAYYNNLPPGEYEFEVQACNNDGVWSGATAGLRLVLQPHYWQTLWFRCLLVLAGGLILAWGYHVRVARLRELEQLRLRIAADLHDDVGASLTKVAMLAEHADQATAPEAEAKPYLHELAQTNRQVIQAMEEIIWTIKLKNDSLDDLVSFMSRYSQKYFQSSGIRCQFELPTDLPEEKLAAEVRHNLFLAFKEALHNVVKHAQAKEVAIRIAVTGRQLTVVVKDNGQGFSPATVSRGGNGLANMRKRMELAGGTLALQSAPGQGTTITLMVGTG